MNTAQVISILVAILATGCSQSNESERTSLSRTELSNSLEYKVASIDAGIQIPESDLSVIRIRNLLTATESVYGIPKERIADMAAKSQQLAKERGLTVTISELLDWSLIACDIKCGESDLIDHLASYISTRKNSGATHHQAIHGLIILSNLTKRLAK